MKYIAPFELFAKREWLSPAAIKSIGSYSFTYAGMHSIPFRPRAPSSLQPKVKTLPSVVNTIECMLPHATLYTVWLNSGLGMGYLDYLFSAISSS